MPKTVKVHLKEIKINFKFKMHMPKANVEVSFCSLSHLKKQLNRNWVEQSMSNFSFCIAHTQEHMSWHVLIITFIYPAHFFLMLAILQTLWLFKPFGLSLWYLWCKICYSFLLLCCAVIYFMACCLLLAAFLWLCELQYISIYYIFLSCRIAGILWHLLHIL